MARWPLGLGFGHGVSYLQTVSSPSGNTNQGTPIRVHHAQSTLSAPAPYVGYNQPTAHSSAGIRLRATQFRCRTFIRGLKSVVSTIFRVCATAHQARTPPASSRGNGAIICLAFKRGLGPWPLMES